MTQRERFNAIRHGPGTFTVHFHKLIVRNDWIYVDPECSCMKGLP